jgi:hypothetical protein
MIRFTKIEVYGKEYKIEMKELEEKEVNVNIGKDIYTITKYAEYIKERGTYHNRLREIKVKCNKKFKHYVHDPIDEYKPLGFIYHGFMGYNQSSNFTQYWSISNVYNKVFPIEEYKGKIIKINQSTLSKFQLNQLVEGYFASFGVIHDGRIIIAANRTCEQQKHLNQECNEEYMSYMTASTQCYNKNCFNRIFHGKNCISHYLEKIEKSKRKIY